MAAVLCTALPSESGCATMGRFWEEFKQAGRDQMRGSMKYGASTSFRHNAAAMRAAREEREAQERERRRRLIGHVAQRAVLKATSEQKGRDIQYVDDGCRVEVKSGYRRKNKAIVTDILVFDRTRKDGGHVHIVIDELGNVLHEEWTVH